MSDSTVISVGLVFGIAIALGGALNAGIDCLVTFVKSRQRTDVVERRERMVGTQSIVVELYADGTGCEYTATAIGNRVMYHPPREFIWRTDDTGRRVEWRRAH